LYNYRGKKAATYSATVIVLPLSLSPFPPSRFVGLTLKQLRKSSVKRRWGFALEVGGVNSQQKKPRQSSEEELTQFYQGNPNDYTESMTYYTIWDHIL
jgi:hypothetical protein